MVHREAMLDLLTSLLAASAIDPGLVGDDLQDGACAAVNEFEVGLSRKPAEPGDDVLHGPSPAAQKAQSAALPAETSSIDAGG
jgi:hypothetical protein